LVDDQFIKLARQPRRRHNDYEDWICEGRAVFDPRDDIKTMVTRD
jgi:hypothetical protein